MRGRTKGKILSNLRIKASVMVAIISFKLFFLLFFILSIFVWIIIYLFPRGFQVQKYIQGLENIYENTRVEVCLPLISAKYQVMPEFTCSRTGNELFCILEKPKISKKDSDNIFRPPRSGNRKCLIKQQKLTSSS